MAPKRKRKNRNKPPAPEDTDSPEKPAVEHEEAAEADAKLGGLGHAAAAGAADSSGKCGGKALQCVNDKRAAALGKTAAAASEGGFGRQQALDEASAKVRWALEHHLA